MTDFSIEHSEPRPSDALIENPQMLVISTEALATVIKGRLDAIKDDTERLTAIRDALFAVADIAMELGDTINQTLRPTIVIDYDDIDTIEPESNVTELPEVEASTKQPAPTLSPTAHYILDVLSSTPGVRYAPALIIDSPDFHWGTTIGARRQAFTKAMRELRELTNEDGTSLIAATGNTSSRQYEFIGEAPAEPVEPVVDEAPLPEAAVAAPEIPENMPELIETAITTVLAINPKPVITVREILVRGFGGAVEQPVFNALKRALKFDSRLEYKGSAEYAVVDRSTTDKWINDDEIKVLATRMCTSAIDRSEHSISLQTAVNRLSEKGVFLTSDETRTFDWYLKNDERVSTVAGSLVTFKGDLFTKDKTNDLTKRIHAAGIRTEQSPYHRRK